MVPFRGRSLWIYAVAVGALLIGLGVAYRQARVPPPLRGTLTDWPADTSDRVIDEALDQIPAPFDSAAFKSRWIDDLAELDLSALAPDRREVFMRFANAERCTCGCGYTLATCRINDPECPSSLPRLEALLDSVRSGWIRSAEGLRERPRPS